MALARFQTHLQFIDSDGNPLSGGSLELYLAGTTTHATAYKDPDGQSAWTWPIPMGATGCPDIWVDEDGAYKYIAKDASDAIIETRDYISCAAGGGGGGLTRVHHDETLDGDGTVESPLSVISGGGLQEVAHDDSLSGLGTTESPLGVVDKGYATITYVDQQDTNVLTNAETYTRNYVNDKVSEEAQARQEADANEAQARSDGDDSTLSHAESYADNIGPKSETSTAPTRVGQTAYTSDGKAYIAGGTESADDWHELGQGESGIQEVAHDTTLTGKGTESEPLRVQGIHDTGSHAIIIGAPKISAGEEEITDWGAIYIGYNDSSKSYNVDTMAVNFAMHALGGSPATITWGTWTGSSGEPGCTVKGTETVYGDELGSLTFSAPSNLVLSSSSGLWFRVTSGRAAIYKTYGGLSISPNVFIMSGSSRSWQRWTIPCTMWSKDITETVAEYGVTSYSNSLSRPAFISTTGDGALSASWDLITGKSFLWYRSVNGTWTSMELGTTIARGYGPPHTNSKCGRFGFYYDITNDKIYCPTDFTTGTEFGSNWKELSSYTHVSHDSSLTGDGTSSDLLSCQTYVDAQVAAETTARESAVTSEATTRGNADTQLQTNIDSEATTRANADTALGTRIDAKLSTVSTDSTLTGSGTADDPLSVVGGGGGTVTTDATLTGDGSSSSPLGVARMTNGSGENAVQFGYGGTANGDYSIAAGKNCTATGKQSFVTGTQNTTTSTGANSIVCGSSNSCAGGSSIVSGYNNEVSADNGNAIIGGRYNVNSRANQVVLGGTYNVSTSGAVIVSGIGDSTTRKNGFEVMNTGCVKSRGIDSLNTDLGSTTPTFVGQTYRDTTTNHIYVATGTSSSSDWVDLMGSSSGLTEVAHDSTLSGLGTSASPLSVVGGGSGVSANYVDAGDLMVRGSVARGGNCDLQDNSGTSTAEVAANVVIGCRVLGLTLFSQYGYLITWTPHIYCSESGKLFKFGTATQVDTTDALTNKTQLGVFRMPGSGEDWVTLPIGKYFKNAIFSTLSPYDNVLWIEPVVSDSSVTVTCNNASSSTSGNQVMWQSCYSYSMSDGTRITSLEFIDGEVDFVFNDTTALTGVKALANGNVVAPVSPSTYQGTGDVSGRMWVLNPTSGTSYLFVGVGTTWKQVNFDA